MLAKIIGFLTKLFTKRAEPINEQPTKALPINSEPNKEVPIPTPTHNEIAVVDERAWVSRAAEAIATFEGIGVDWGNPVGNFDGAYLTCGLIGFTWKYNNQPPMILEFVKRHGEQALKLLMPNYGAEYIRAAKLGQYAGADIVAKWSIGYNVKPAIKAELRAFWTSPGMVAIQKEKIWDMVGKWGIKKMYETQEYFGFAEPRYEHLLYWMDQATLSGTGKTPDFQEHKNVTLEQIFAFCATKGGYNSADLRKNGKLWQQMISSSPYSETVLFKLAYLRATRSSGQFMGAVMNRRGTLASLS